MLGFTGESSVQAATFDWRSKAAAAAFVGASSAKPKSGIARCALDQASRFADLSLSKSSSSRHQRDGSLSKQEAPKHTGAVSATGAVFAMSKSA